MHPAFVDKVEIAARILRDAGATSVYVFGSVADEKEMLPGREPKDIDLAVEGLPPQVFFKALSDVCDALKFPVDLIDLDEPTLLAKRLRERGRLRRVA